MPVLVKICGLRTAVDCRLALKAGAQALGFVHYQPSPRHLQLEQIKALVRQLPPFACSVGLLVNPTEAQILAMHATGVHCLQIHGSGGEICTRLGIAYIQTLAVADSQSFADIDNAIYANSQALLLDTYHKAAVGGQGISFDWSLIPSKLNKPIILAGGLHPDNVAEAVRRVQPYAVDVSSGVESAPGTKDPQRIRSFIANATAV